MRRAIAFILLLAAAPGLVPAQSQSSSRPRQNPDRDFRGLTCAQILQMGSSDWVAKSADGNDSAADAKLRAIASYGRCFDARTDQLAAALAKSGKGPSRAARDDFRDFEMAMKDFSAKAFAASGPPADAMKSAYAALYEKQFRYAFYRSYEQKILKPQPHPSPATPAANTTGAPAAPQSASASSAPAPTAKEQPDIDPFAQAKNHFGELLDALPDDQMHELHAAFGKILGPHATTNEARLAVYRYAIFLLEPPSAAPFSPPPF
jgi:hypothetical protein